MRACGPAAPLLHAGGTRHNPRPLHPVSPSHRFHNLYTRCSALAEGGPGISQKVFFDIQQGDTKLGRIVMGLYGAPPAGC